MSELIERMKALSPEKRELYFKKINEKQRKIKDSYAGATHYDMMTIKQMTTEAELNFDVTIKAPIIDLDMAPKGIFLTGVTGFLGAFLLNELLHKTDAVIYCLVRASSIEEGRQRIENHIQRLIIGNIVKQNQSRIVPVPGDFSKPLLGLSPSEFEALGERLQCIYHVGAAVKFTYTYSALKDANVKGTNEIIRLAAQGKTKPLHFVSTVAVFATPEFEDPVCYEQEELEESGSLIIGYAQSKWVAEKMISMARARGLPACIYRPGTIGGHSLSGAFDTQNHICRFFKGCVQLKSAPEMERFDDLTDISPVDYISAALAHISLDKTSYGKVFHLTNPNPRIMWNTMMHWLTTYGYQMEFLPFDEWKIILQKEIAESQENALFAISPIIADYIADDVKLPVYDCTNTLKSLKGTGIKCPEVDEKLVHTYLNFLMKTGYIENPPDKNKLRQRFDSAKSVPQVQQSTTYQSKRAYDFTPKVAELARERRHKIGTRFSGEITTLIEKGANTGQRPIVDIHHCTLTLSTSILMYFADTTLIYHSTGGCINDISNVSYLAAKVRGIEDDDLFEFEKNNIHVCNTGFSEKDVIYGGEEHLKNAVREANQRYNPKMICVMASCISAIIGDDVVKVCEEMQEEFGEGVYVIPLLTQGFQTHAWLNHADITWSALVNRVMKEPKEVDPLLVNFFRTLTLTTKDEIEIKRLLGAIGLKVNIFPGFQKIETLERAPEAGLNTGMCKGFHQPVFEFMQERFGTPYADAPFPLGINFTSKWLREIGQKVGKQAEVEELIKKEHERIAPQLEKLREKLRGKSVYISANHGRTLSFVRVCEELGMNILAMTTHSSDNTLHYELESLQQCNGNVTCAVGSPNYEELSYINQIKPDIIVGRVELATVAATLGYPIKSTYMTNFQGAHAGFEGVIQVGKGILNGLNNPLKDKILSNYWNSTGLNWQEVPFLDHPNPFKFVAKAGEKEKGESCGAHRHKRCTSSLETEQL